MEAEDLRKLAEKAGASESDTALALRETKDDIADAEKLLAKSIHILKGCYAAKTNRLNGGFVMLVDVAPKRMVRMRTLASYDSAFADISMDTPWDLIEKKIFEAEIKQNMVPAISRDLAGEMEYILREGMEETITQLTQGKVDDLGTRLRRIICTCLGDSDVDIRCAIEKMTPLALKIQEHTIKPDAPAATTAGGETPAAAAPETGAAPAPISEDRSIFLKTDVLLSPVAGVPVTTLNPGDYILVKITDTRPQAAYIANLLHISDGRKSLPVRVPIRKIDRSESQRLMITTEFGPGVYGRTVVQEGLKVKCTPDEKNAQIPDGLKLPLGQVFLIIAAALVVLGLLLAVVYYFMMVI